MRHAVRWVALIALTIGVSILVATAATAHDRHQVMEAAATDFGVGLIHLAITVGVVDLLLKSYAERQHRQSVAPRVEELSAHLRNLSIVSQRHLATPALADLERYRRVAVEVQQSAFGLYILMSTSDTVLVLASNLLRLSHEMREHIETIEDAIASWKNAATDFDKSIRRIKGASEHVFESGCQLTDQLAIRYPPTPAAVEK